MHLMSLPKVLTVSCAALALAALCAPDAHAQFTAYSNTTNFSGFAYANAGATSATPITNLVADDIQLASGFGGVTISRFSFSVANLGAAAFTARARVRFYDMNVAGDGPGNYITGYTFQPINFAPGVGVFSTAADSTFVVPLSGSFWAGITFDNVNSTATVDQLNSLGQGLFNPPTIGTSEDAFFQTTAPGSFVSNNPAGSLRFFGGTPAASFGWQFQTLQPAAVDAPEPGSIALALAAGAPAIGIIRRRRKPRA